MNYYNENDPKAAAWLRELIAAGELPPGIVDERSITDVRKSDLQGYTQFHTFCGVGGWPLALNLAGWPEDQEVWTGSCPCQPFSQSGNREGKRDERHLWPQFLRLIEACRPPIIFGEQVSGADGRNWLGGDEGLQRLFDREAVVRILQTQGGIEGIPNDLQNLFVRDKQKTQGVDSEGCSRIPIQGISTKESSEGVAHVGSIASEEKGDRILSLASLRKNPRCHRCGRLRTDRDTVQSGRRKDLGQSISRSGDFFEGIFDLQCACGAILRKCDGEHMGRRQDRGDCGRDNERSEIEDFVLSIQTGRTLKSSPEFIQLAGVRADLEALGYGFGASDLCAASVGAPHIRQRLYWMAYACGSRPLGTGTGTQGERRETLRSSIGGSDGRVAHAASGGLGINGSASRECGHADFHGETVWMGDPTINGREMRESLHGELRREGFSEGCPTGGLADANGRVEGNGGIQRSGQHGFIAQNGEPVERLGDTDDARSQGRGLRLGSEQGQRTHWEAGFEIVHCTDGKARRFERGTFPLVDGLSGRVVSSGDLGVPEIQNTKEARVMRLRGYGNAIVPQLAAQFIMACMDVLRFDLK